MLRKAAGDAKERSWSSRGSRMQPPVVIHVMEAARNAGLTHITFATQPPPGARGTREEVRRPAEAAGDALAFRDRLVATWYAPRVTWLSAMLMPLSLAVGGIVAARRALYERGVLRSGRAWSFRGRRGQCHHRRRRQDTARDRTGRSARPRGASPAS